MCVGISIHRAVKKVEVPPGGSVKIVAIGGLGHIGRQLAKAMIGFISITLCVIDLALLNPIMQSYKSYRAIIPVSTLRSSPWTHRQLSTLPLLRRASNESPRITSRRHHHAVSQHHSPHTKLGGSLVGDNADSQELVDVVAKHDINVNIKEWKPEQVEEMTTKYPARIERGQNIIIML